MANTGSGTSTSAASVGYSFSLAQLIAKWRRMLDDENIPYLWSNDELADYADYIQKDLCADMDIISDRSTAAICNITIAAGDGEIELDRRIIAVTRAKLASETHQLGIRTDIHMDTYYPGWEDVTDQSTPTILVTQGRGNNLAYVYPPSDASDTIMLTVIRLPLEDVDFGLHSNEPLEIDRYVHLIHHGIFAQAYLKQDTDTYDPKRAENHRIRWEGETGNGGDKEKIRRMVLRRHQSAQSATPMTAFM